MIIKVYTHFCLLFTIVLHRTRINASVYKTGLSLSTYSRRDGIPMYRSLGVAGYC